MCCCRVLALALAAIGCVGCRSMLVTEEYDQKRHSGKAGVVYCLPATRLKIVAEKTKSATDGKQIGVTATAVRVPTGAPYFLKHKAAGSYHDDFDLSVGDTGLLQSVNAASTDKMLSIAEQAVSMVASAAKLAAGVPGAAMRQPDHPTADEIALAVERVNEGRHTFFSCPLAGMDDATLNPPIELPGTDGLLTLRIERVTEIAAEEPDAHFAEQWSLWDRATAILPKPMARGPLAQKTVRRKVAPGVPARAAVPVETTVKTERRKVAPGVLARTAVPVEITVKVVMPLQKLEALRQNANQRAMDAAAKQGGYKRADIDTFAETGAKILDLTGDIGVNARDIRNATNAATLKPLLVKKAQLEKKLKLLQTLNAVQERLEAGGGYTGEYLLVSASTLIDAPDGGRVLCVPTKRLPFVKVDRKYTFSNGVLTKVDVDRPSWVEGMIGVPANLLSSALGELKGILTFRKEMASEEKAALEAEIGLIQTRKAMAELRSQLEGQ